MSSRGQVTIAARVTVLVVAPIILFFWVRLNPSRCVTDYDLPMKVVALGTLAVSLLPIVTRVVRRTDQRRGDAWTVLDVALGVGMIALLIFIQSGKGRMVIYDGCGGWAPPRL